MKYLILRFLGKPSGKRYPTHLRRTLAVGGLFALCLAVAVFCQAADADQPAWRYVTPENGEPMEHAPLKTLSLSETKPPDLKESVAYRGDKRLYGEFRFGSPNSKTVAVVLDCVSAEKTNIYVDANRDREIDKNELLAGSGPKYRLPLNVEIVKGSDVERHARSVVFRLGRAGRSISYATAGYMEGTVRLEDREVPVRRMDANGDGGMADTADLLWINFNRDGKWNPFTDRTPVGPILKLGSERYAVGTDWVGERFSLKILEGTGTIELALSEMKNRDALLDFEVMLTGREGSIVRLDLAKSSDRVPIGEYSIFQMSVTMKDPAGGEPWLFTFNAAEDARATCWREVKADGRTSLDPLAGMKLKGTPEKTDLKCEPGEELSIQPILETGDNLPLVRAYRNKADSANQHPGAEISLRTPEGKTLSTIKSGFS